MKHYNSYHTTLMILAARRKLPYAYSSCIDRSTLWCWIKEPGDKNIGSELSDIEILEIFISRKEAQTIMKAYVKIALLLGAVFSVSKLFHQILKVTKLNLSIRLS